MESKWPSLGPIIQGDRVGKQESVKSGNNGVTRFEKILVILLMFFFYVMEGEKNEYDNGNEWEFMDAHYSRGGRSRKTVTA